MYFLYPHYTKSKPTPSRKRYLKTFTLWMWVLIVFNTISPLKPAMASLNHSHDYSVFKENITPPPKENKRTVRFYQEAPYSENNEDGEDLKAWLENTKASNNNSLDGPVDDSYMQKILKNMIDNPAITPVLTRSTAKPSGRISYQYHLAINSLPIWQSHIKAIKMHDDAITILGDIPTSIYDPDHFERAIMDIHDQKDQTLIDMMSNSLAEHDTSFDPQKLSLVAKHACVLSLDDHFVPGICAYFLYNYSYYEVTFHHLGLASYARIASHACAILKDIYTLNPQTEKRDFAVEVCSQRSSPNALANKRIIAGGTEECRSTDPLIASSLDKKTLLENSLESTDFLLNSLLPSYGVSHSTGSTSKPRRSDFQPSALTFENGTFTHKGSSSLSSRHAHVFSYINRMYEWFVSLGFKSRTSDAIYLIVQTPTTSSFIKDGEAFYSGIFNNPSLAQLTQKHFIAFGNNSSKKNKQNLAYDFDVSAHELSHYVISHHINAQFTTQPDSEGKFKPKAYNDNYPNPEHTSAIHEGLADYFTFAATGNSCLAETIKTKPIASIGLSDKNCLRTAEPPFTYQGSETSGKSNTYTLLRVNNYFHSLGQLLSGMLWTARKSLKNNRKKKLFDKTILDSLEFSPNKNVSFVDIIEAFLRSDDEIAGKQFCKPLLDAADKYKLLNITESTTKARIDRMRNNCPTSTTTTYALTSTVSYSATRLRSFDVALTSTGTCKSPRDRRQDTILTYGSGTGSGTGSIAPSNGGSSSTSTEQTSQAGQNNSNGETLPENTDSSSGCSDMFSFNSIAHGQALDTSSELNNPHNQLSWWWLWMCLPLWVIMIIRKKLSTSELSTSEISK